MGFQAIPRSFVPLDTVIPGPLARTPKKGMELVDLRSLGMIQSIMGGAPLGTTEDALHGHHSSGDVVTRTADGRDLNEIWTEFMTLLNAVNEERQGLIRFLTYPVSQAVESITLPGDGVDFEEASEYGEPVAGRVQPNTVELGYTFKWYDLASRYTWQYLADATSAMIEAVANAAVEAYYRKQLFTVLRRVFNPAQETTSITGQPGAGTFPVYGFYNADGFYIPRYKSNTFDPNTYTHYRDNGNEPLSPTDLDLMVIDALSSHGYRMERGYRLVTMVNPHEGNLIRGFRRGVDGARYDFIPATNQPGQIVDRNFELMGQSQLGPSLDGLTVIGNYGPLTIVEDDYMPENYVFTFATGGAESLQNPVGLREHARADLRGLRLVKGRTPDYPLLDSFWAVGFGTGVRHRGGGLVLQTETAGGSYVTPSLYA